MLINTIVPVSANEQIARDIFLLKLPLIELKDHAQPGQFVNLYFDDPQHLFPRPFSIAGFDEERLLILYKKVGTMTTRLTTLGPGATLKIIGPLGNFFNCDENFPVLLAGGIGLAPLLFLSQKFKASNQSYRLVIGSRTAAEAPFLEQIYSADYVTDDGTYGQATNVVNYFKEIYPQLPQPLTVYACGPEPMLKALRHLSVKMGFRLQVSIEGVMACGLGLCQGCAVKVKDSTYKLICKDGPVFDGDDLGDD